MASMAGGVNDLVGLRHLLDRVNVVDFNARVQFVPEPGE